MDKDKKLIFEALENPEVLERSVSRRGALGLSGKFGAGVALATMPVMLAALTRRAFAQGTLPNEIVNPLNFALVLEYLESDFYTMGLESDGLIPDEDRAIFEQLSKHETAHVAFLSSVLGSAAAIRPQWDFTAKGAFDPFNDYPTFTLLSQGFEDAGAGLAGTAACTWPLSESSASAARATAHRLRTPDTRPILPGACSLRATTQAACAPRSRRPCRAS